MAERRTAYWTQRQREPSAAVYPPLDFTVCWRNGCTKSGLADRHPRLRGRYCAGCLALTEADLARIDSETTTPTSPHGRDAGSTRANDARRA